MPTSTNSAGSQSLTTYKALSFDVFGTLLDWESGMYPQLQPVIRQLNQSNPATWPFPCTVPSPSEPRLARKHPAFVAFDTHEAKLMAEMPSADYRRVLGWALRDMGTQFDATVSDEEMAAAGASVDRWPAFADTVAALQRLQKHYKLVALSNVSNDAIRAVLEGAFKDVRFDAVYTAQDIGSYKPAMDNFEYLLDGVKREFAVDRHQLLHVAHGVTSDQLPAEGMDIDHVWVERGVDNWGEVSRDGMKRLRVVSDMKQLADEVDAAFPEAGGA